MFGLSRTRAADLIAGGLVRMDGAEIGKSDRVLPGAVLDVTIAWSGVYNDLDLRVFDADGNELAVDGAFATETESVSVPLPGAGTYVVEVTSYLAEPGVSYDATATVTTSKCGPP